MSFLFIPSGQKGYLNDWTSEVTLANLSSLRVNVLDDRCLKIRSLWYVTLLTLKFRPLSNAFVIIREKEVWSVRNNTVAQDYFLCLLKLGIANDVLLILCWISVQQCCCNINRWPYFSATSFCTSLQLFTGLVLFQVSIGWLQDKKFFHWNFNSMLCTVGIAS